jgi:hypothetical protein
MSDSTKIPVYQFDKEDAKPSGAESIKIQKMSEFEPCKVSHSKRNEQHRKG